MRQRNTYIDYIKKNRSLLPNPKKYRATGTNQKLKETYDNIQRQIAFPYVTKSNRKAYIDYIKTYRSFTDNPLTYRAIGTTQTLRETALQLSAKITNQTRPKITSQTRPKITNQTRPKITSQTRPKITNQTRPKTNTMDSTLSLDSRRIKKAKKKLKGLECIQQSESDCGHWSLRHSLEILNRQPFNPKQAKLFEDWECAITGSQLHRNLETIKTKFPTITNKISFGVRQDVLGARRTRSNTVDVSNMNHPDIFTKCFEKNGVIVFDISYFEFPNYGANQFFEPSNNNHFHSMCMIGETSGYYIVMDSNANDDDNQEKQVYDVALCIKFIYKKDISFALNIMNRYDGKIHISSYVTMVNKDS